MLCVIPSIPTRNKNAPKAKKAFKNKRIEPHGMLNNGNKIRPEATATAPIQDNKKMFCPVCKLPKKYMIVPMKAAKPPANNPVQPAQRLWSPTRNT